MQKIHLICGPSGAGKTTHAHKIATETQAFLLAIDECLKPLSIPDNVDLAYGHTVLEKAKRCAGLILEKATQLLSQGNDVVLDVATFRRAERDIIRNWAASVNSSVVLYYIYASRVTRWSRITKRNAEKGKTYSFVVPQWWFDFAEQRFEPPKEDEAAILINTEQ